MFINCDLICADIISHHILYQPLYKIKRFQNITLLYFQTENNPFHEETGCVMVLLCAVFPACEIIKYFFRNAGAPVVRGSSVHAVRMNGQRAWAAAVCP